MMPLRVCIDARVTYGQAGGIEQFILGLAHGLSQLTDSPDRYHFLTNAGEGAWLKPYLTGPAMPAAADADHPRSIRFETARRLVPQRMRTVIGAWLAANVERVAVPPTDGFVERGGYDLVHFTRQAAFRTALPSIYHPHDLQHIHLPEFFTVSQRRMRDRRFAAFCAAASIVPVSSSWCRDDVIAHLGLDPAKVVVVPLAPVIEAYRAEAGDIARARVRHSLPERFLFYPAQTWPHKNHLALIDALSILRRQGLVVPLVCSGRRNEHFPIIQARVEESGLNDQVSFLGFVEDSDLKALYRAAYSVVIPTLFEAASFPLWEAFLARTPAACSNVTSLPRQAGDAALVFNPRDPEEIARSVARLWTDDPLRAALIERGAARVARYSWLRTARMFRALYRRVCGRPLSADERELIEADPDI
jgi:glycosyltransferase involved in cell wall biosynthesis